METTSSSHFLSHLCLLAMISTKRVPIAWKPSQKWFDAPDASAFSIAARSVRSLIGIEYDLGLISVCRPNHKLECKSLAAIAVFDWTYLTSLNSPIVHLLQCCYCHDWFVNYVSSRRPAPTRILIRTQDWETLYKVPVRMSFIWLFIWVWFNTQWFMSRRDYPRRGGSVPEHVHGTLSRSLSEGSSWSEDWSTTKNGVKIMNMEWINTFS